MFVSKVRKMSVRSHRSRSQFQNSHLHLISMIRLWFDLTELQEQQLAVPRERGEQTPGWRRPTHRAEAPRQCHNTGTCHSEKILVLEGKTRLGQSKHATNPLTSETYNHTFYNVETEILQCEPSSDRKIQQAHAFRSRVSSLWEYCV